MEEIEELKNLYFDEVESSDIAPHLIVLLNKKENLSYPLDKKMSNDIIDNHKDNFKTILKNLIGFIKEKEGVDFTEIMVLSEVHYVEVPKEEEKISKLPPSQNPLAKESVICIVESKSQIEFSMYDIEYDTNKEGRKLLRTPKQDIILKIGENDYNDFVSNSKMCVIF